jgi:hypothetical protein
MVLRFDGETTSPEKFGENETLPGNEPGFEVADADLLASFGFQQSKEISISLRLTLLGYQLPLRLQEHLWLLQPRPQLPRHHQLLRL